MNATTIIHLLGSTGVFPSRAFIPAFLTASLIRFGGQLGSVPLIGTFMQESPILSTFLSMGAEASAPTWFTHDITIAVLGVLSILEIIATKQTDVRKVMDELDTYIKPGMAFFTGLGVLTATDQNLISQIAPQGFGDVAVAMMVGGIVFFLTSFRKTIMQFLSDADEDDDLGIRWFISWIEDLWATFGLLLLLLYPLIMLALVASIGGVLFLVRKYMEYREDQSKVPCSGCSKPIYPSACACPSCKTKVERPLGIGFFGQSKTVPAVDVQGHPFDLVEKKRCPVCASRLSERDPYQTCAACGHELMKDAEFSRSYMARVGARLPTVLVVSTLFGLLPVIGLIPAIIYYRINLVGPFRRYLSATTGCLVKWVLRLIIFCLIVFQIIPGIGAFIVGLMAFLEYEAYRRVFESSLKRKSGSKSNVA